VHAGISTNKRQSGAKPPVIDESSENDNGIISNHHGALDHEKPKKEDIRQIQDENEIRKRVDELPKELRKSLVDEFKVNFVSIEQIDPKQLF